jgi:parallel beta-helix repeat protein
MSGNSMTQNSYCGVEIYSSSDNTLSGNNVTGNSDIGISLDSSSGNVFFRNVIGNNVYNLGVSGFKLSDYVDSIDTSNLVNGKPVYYYVNQEGLAISPSTHPNVGYLGLVNCTNITVEHLVITDNLQGVLLAYTNDSTVTENNLASNTFGIYLEGSSGNTVSGNDVTENSEAVWLDSSSDNAIYHNNFMNNLHQVYTGDLVNAWDNGYPSGGNFWSNYNGVDEKRGPKQDQLGSDGIGDTPCNADHYPLMQPWSALPQSYNGNLRALHA